MDKDTGDDLVELCLGPIAESYPPQCGGPAITNWDWKSVDGMFEQQGDVRWGTFAVTGTWDGTAFTVSDAIPAALYDPMPEEPPVYPEPSVDLSDTELQRIADEVSGLPGIQGAYADTETGHVLTDVTYDDGSYQDYVDEIVRRRRRDRDRRAGGRRGVRATGRLPVAIADTRPRYSGSALSRDR